jgi:hypothetical protein
MFLINHDFLPDFHFPLVIGCQIDGDAKRQGTGIIGRCRLDELVETQEGFMRQVGGGFLAFDPPRKKAQQILGQNLVPT